MHIFLQGPRGIGKSTVILRTLDILASGNPLILGGFFTWNGGKTDPHVYMRPARSGRENEICRLASYDAAKGGLISNISAFDVDGARLLMESKDADLIIMDELGFLESGAEAFKQAVLDTLNGSTPILGVLRLGGVPWHEEIKRSLSVTIFEVDEKTRETLPQELALSLKNKNRRQECAEYCHIYPI